VFAAGLVKYGERIWALQRGNISSIRDSFNRSVHSVDPSRFVTAGGGIENDEEILLDAHHNLLVCKSVFLDAKLETVGVGQGFVPIHVEQGLLLNIYKLVEMELSLMYDILYTKADIIHTCLGFCIHCFALIGTSITLCLFLLHIISRINQYSLADVIISFVLLGGALILEIISVCRAVLSSWAYYSFVHSNAQQPVPVPAQQPAPAGPVVPAQPAPGPVPAQQPAAPAGPVPAQPERIFRIWACLRRLAGPTGRRQWRSSIGQYNLLHLCTRDKTELGGRLATKVGMEDWWNKMHLSGTFTGTNSLSMQRLKELLVLEGQVRPETGYFNSRGRLTLQRRHAYRNLAEWSVGIDFDESIVVWHIATDVFLYALANENNYGLRRLSNESELIEATRVLSNYMMFLLVKKPDMLPGRTRHNLYLDPCQHIQNLITDDCMPNPDPRSCDWYHRLKELFHCDPPNDSNMTYRENLARNLYQSAPVCVGASTIFICFDSSVIFLLVATCNFCFHASTLSISDYLTYFFMHLICTILVVVEFRK
jgi:hypothetical protein